MDRAMADPHHPNLGLGNAGAQPVACLQLIAVHLVHSAFDVDGCKLTLVVGLALGSDGILVNGVATPRELFFAVAALDRAHNLSSSSASARDDLARRSASPANFNSWLCGRSAQRRFT